MMPLSQSFKESIPPPLPESLVYPQLIEKIVNWYKKNHEIFPWRETVDPYRVWISEVMLQQTTVQTVIPYFQKFMKTFPHAATLADTSIDAVLTHWQGLGYYRRAHQLHKASKVINTHCQGAFPETFKDLLGLPGVGEYTAAAIMAMAYGQPHIPVDGNVCRVFSRLFAINDTPKNLLKEVKAYTKRCEPVLGQYDGNFPGHFAQGLMDLGREVCTPKAPKCTLCPIHSLCQAAALHIQEQLPLKEQKKTPPTRYATCWVYRKEGMIFLQKRSEKGLLSGLWQCPMTDFADHPIPSNPLTWTAQIHHIFTHFKLIVSIHKGEDSDLKTLEGEWVHAERLSHYALPTLTQKILKAASREG